MNIYVTTEGVVETIVYKYWIPYINPNLTCVDYLQDVTDNNFILFSGGGFPHYFEVIANAIEDVNLNSAFDRLVISVDSEEETYAAKRSEILGFVAQTHCRVEVRVIIQHFCFETWGLGNIRIVRPNTQSQLLRKYRAIFDVRSNDPEDLPPNNEEELNRSQFAEKYLRVALNDKFRNLTYSKRNPRALLHNTYFNQLQSRFSNTGHIASFHDFLNAFN